MSVTISGSGQIIKQVIQTVKTDVFTSATAGTWTAITGLSASITPTNSANKILVSVSVSFGSAAAGNYDIGFALYRNGSVITGATGDASGSRKRVTFSGAGRQDYELSNGNMTYIDSPATTSATTYAVYANYDSGTIYINRCVSDGDATGTERGISTITLMEVAYA